jgi:hypothetical protein
MLSIVVCENTVLSRKQARAHAEISFLEGVPQLILTKLQLTSSLRQREGTREGTGSF